MGKGSSQPTTTTTVQKTELDPLTQQWRGQIFDAAQNQYKQGMPGYFPGSTVVPFSDQTQAGLNYMQDYASMGPVGLPQAQGAVGAAMGGNPWAAMTAGYAAPAGMTGMGALAQTARGDFIGKNPNMDRMSQQIMDRVNAQFSDAGRYGSGAQADALASGLGDLYGTVYNSERNNQLSAAGTLGQMGLSGLGTSGTLYDAGLERGLQGAQALPGLYNYGLMPADTMMNAGSQYENLAGQYVADAQNRYNYDANSGRANVSWLADMMNGLPTAPTTTQTTTTPQQRRSSLLGALGGASGGAGIASALGVTGPWGWGLAGLGALGGAFG